MIKGTMDSPVMKKKTVPALKLWAIASTPCGEGATAKG
jgi:hypothetical protein